MAAIRGYIAVDNPFYADVFAARLVAASESPDQLAERGRVVPELSRSDVRELLFQHYRIIYRLGAHRVDILALVHGARLGAFAASTMERRMIDAPGVCRAQALNELESRARRLRLPMGKS